MSDIQQLLTSLTKFRDERDWKQFHDPKNLASAISIEAAELNELFLWKTTEESFQVEKTKIKEELADILNYCFLLADQQGFDIAEIMSDKIAQNESKYPVRLSKGNATKYNQR